MVKPRVAILISGRGSNMMALIEAARKASYPAEIALVISNQAAAAGLGRAKAAGIATAIVEHAPFGSDRQRFEAAMQEVIERSTADLICLAGFMRLLTPWFVRRWEGRMLNVHPALLPAFKGLDTHRRALRAGVRIHGATVHFVSAEMDSGPIIAQGATAVRGDDTEQMLAARVLEIEHRIYPMALGLLAAGRVRVTDGRCVIDGEVENEAVIIAPETGRQTTEDRGQK
jgi:phosphoribosylglycinamide formyltransferase-1